jgi:hypothetical protein
MKNQLTDLNNHLFAQLERLGDEGLDTDALARELRRGAGIAAVSREIVANARLVLDAEKARAEHERLNIPMLENRK